MLHVACNFWGLAGRGPIIGRLGPGLRGEFYFGICVSQARIFFWYLRAAGVNFFWYLRATRAKFFLVSARRRREIFLVFACRRRKFFFGICAPDYFIILIQKIEQFQPRFFPEIYSKTDDLVYSKSSVFELRAAKFFLLFARRRRDFFLVFARRRRDFFFWHLHVTGARFLWYLRAAGANFFGIFLVFVNKDFFISIKYLRAAGAKFFLLSARRRLIPSRQFLNRFLEKI